jgi:hypothetical protein
MTLYEISGTYKLLIDMIEAGDIPEEAIADTFEAVAGEFDEKADQIACMIKNLDAESSAIKAEEKALAERRQAKERKADGMKKYLSDQMQLIGKLKLETPRNRLSFRASTALYLQDEAGFIEGLNEEDAKRFVVTTKKVDRTAIREALKAGESFDGLSLETRQNLQIK